MSIRPYRDADAAAVIGIFRRFMAELTPPRLRAEFDAYVETAIGEELGRIREYYLGRPGVGRALLAAAEGFSRRAGYREIVLSTSELQVAAMRLYEASGYRRVRTEIASMPSHKTPGAGLARHHYEKVLQT